MSPCAVWTNTKFDGRLDHTLSAKDNALRPIQL